MGLFSQPHWVLQQQQHCGHHKTTGEEGDDSDQCLRWGRSQVTALRLHRQGMPQSRPGESRLTTTSRRKVLNYHGFCKLSVFSGYFGIVWERMLKIALSA